MKPKPPGDVGGGGHLAQFGHARDADGADHAAVVVQVGLNDVQAAMADRPLEAPMVHAGIKIPNTKEEKEKGAG